MTTFLKQITLMLCVLVLAIAFVPTANAENSTEIEYYGYALLTTEYEKIAYNAISDGIRNCERMIEFQLGVEDYSDANKDQYIEEIKNATEKALRLVMADHPEYFWYDGDGGLSIYHDTLTTFKVVFQTHEYSVDGKAVTKADVDQYIQQVEAAANKALKDMPTDRDLAKIHYLHDYLAANIDYEFSDDDQTIFGALVEGKAVCAGYARAYQYLLTKAGIRCWYVPGKSINPTTMNTVAHAWNLVYLDGKCYYTDVTWDDQEEIYHAYYMVSEAEMGTSHFPDHPEDLPASCGHTDLDYFEVHKGVGTGVGMLTGSYDVATLASYMTKVNDDTWHCHVEDLTGGGAQPFVTWLKANENAVAAALGIQGGFSWWLDIIWDEYHVAFHSMPYVHQHDAVLTGRPAKEPTCTENGNTQYFVCDSCGTMFRNWNGSEEIEDANDIVIPALGHNYTQIVQTEDQHYKACVTCGLEQPDSREAHYDNNKDRKCDVCGIKVAAPTESTTEPTTAPTIAPTTAPTTEPTMEPTMEPTTEPTAAPTVEPTQTPSVQPSTEVTTEPTQGATELPTEEPVTEPTQNQSSQPSQPVTEPSAEPTGPSSGVTESPSAPTQGNEPTKSTDSTKSPQAGEGSDIVPEDNSLTFIIAVVFVVAVIAAVCIVLVIKRKK